MQSLKKVLMLAAIGGCAEAPSTEAIESELNCGSLCIAGNTQRMLITPLVSFQNDTAQNYFFLGPPGGSVAVDVAVNGNSGTESFDDGTGHGDCVTVSINGQDPCLSDVRRPSLDGCFTRCSGVITTNDGVNQLTLSYHQHNGTEGWTIQAGTIDLTVQ
jgi:hypothetical protein